MVALLLRGPVSTLEARELVGALNVAEVVRQLRHEHGLPIVCRRRRIPDRDGKMTRPGSYLLPPDAVPVAKALLSVWNRAKAANDVTEGDHEQL